MCRSRSTSLTVSLPTCLDNAARPGIAGSIVQNWMRLHGADTSLDYVEFNGTEEVDHQMWFVIETIAGQTWRWLPAITVVLRFGTALISFVLAACVVVRRVRRRSPRRPRRRAGLS